jgi:hypothetical protein
LKYLFFENERQPFFRELYVGLVVMVPGRCVGTNRDATGETGVLSVLVLLTHRVSLSVFHQVEDVLIRGFRGACNFVPCVFASCPTQYNMCLIRLGLVDAFDCDV